ncbi:hypothetical protein ACF0H5_005886 [Mactra antiquata]
MPSKQTKIFRVNATKETKVKTDHCATTTSKGHEASTTVVATGSVVKSGNDDQTQVEENGDGDEDLADDKSESKCKVIVEDIINMNTNQKGRRKKGKKKKKEKNIGNTETECVENLNNKNVRLPPLPKRVPVNIKQGASTGCFGFVSSWLRKKMEKRREKKRIAIKARSSNSVTTQLEYERKKSRGGVAFTVEFDDRPIKKPLLPPIKPKSGPIKLDHEDKMLQAERIRKQQLEKKVRFAGTHEEKRVENADRKADNERGFKQKAELTILAKQGQARRNQSRIEMSRRCASSMRRPGTPYVMSRVTSRLDDTDDELNDMKYLE